MTLHGKYFFTSPLFVLKISSKMVLKISSKMFMFVIYALHDLQILHAFISVLMFLSSIFPALPT